MEHINKINYIFFISCVHLFLFIFYPLFPQMRKTKDILTKKLLPSNYLTYNIKNTWCTSKYVYCVCICVCVNHKFGVICVIYFLIFAFFFNVQFNLYACSN